MLRDQVEALNEKIEKLEFNLNIERKMREELQEENKRIIQIQLFQGGAKVCFILF